MNYLTLNKLFNSKKLFLIIASSLVLASCASAPTAPEGAVEVRNKLSAITSNPDLANFAPMEIREAEAAVALVEQPLKEKDEALSKHQLYMADYKVGIAAAKANTAMLEARRASLGDERDAARLQARTLEVDKARADASDARYQQEQAAVRSEQENAELQQQIKDLEAEATDRGLVLTLGDVLFANGSADLRSGTNVNLDKLANFLNAYPERSAVIEGHTDNVGSVGFNQNLSQRRADAVRSYLIQRGVPMARLATAGLGMDRPVANNETQDGRQQNRRVEIIIPN